MTAAASCVGLCGQLSRGLPRAGEGFSSETHAADVSTGLEGTSEERNPHTLAQSPPLR